MGSVQSAQCLIHTYLDPYTQTPQYWNQTEDSRKALYVNDVFRLDPALPSICWHDFRLAPTAHRIDGIFKNPLVNQGVDLGYDRVNQVPLHIGVIGMANGTSTPCSPGLPPMGYSGGATPAEDLVNLNAWDNDCEGAGNPRVELRRYASVPSSSWRVDIGADESAEVMLSGFVDSTRTFTHPHPTVASNTASIVGGTGLYYDPNHSMTWSRFSLVNPPLTVPQKTWSATDQSWLVSPNDQVNPIWIFDWPQLGRTQYMVNSFGWAGPDLPPYEQDSAWHGIRFNLELYDPNNSNWVALGVGKNNMQTILVVEGGGAPIIEPLPHPWLTGGRSTDKIRTKTLAHPKWTLRPNGSVQADMQKKFQAFQKTRLKK